MSRHTTEVVHNFSIYWLNSVGAIPADGQSNYNQRIVWLSNREEDGNINYGICLEDVKYMRLDYRIKSYGTPEEEYISINYNISLEATMCHFGGKRWYFRCPLLIGGKYCGKRVGILYNVGRYFGCRNCANLTYYSCNKNKKYRELFQVCDNQRRAGELRAKIGRTHYAGRSTRKYRRFLKLIGGYNKRVQSDLNKMLKTCKM